MSLFIDSGKPMKFYMTPCERKSELKAAIEGNGGRMLHSYQHEAIELVDIPIGDSLPPLYCFQSHKLYLYQYVVDSIEVLELQSLEEYEITHLTVADSTRKDHRNKYTREDNNKMIEYAEGSATKKNTVKYWKLALEHGLDVAHSAESLRSHWKRLKSRVVVEDSQVKRRIFIRPQESSVAVPLQIRQTATLVKSSQSPAKLPSDVLASLYPPYELEFERLLCRCQSSGATAREILQVLVHFHGDSSKTHSYFLNAY